MRVELTGSRPQSDAIQMMMPALSCSAIWRMLIPKRSVMIWGQFCLTCAMGRQWIILPSIESAQRRKSQPVAGKAGVCQLSATDLGRGIIEFLLLLFDPFTAHTDGYHHDPRPC